MKATVIIPNMNGIKYLEDCLHSVRENTMAAKVIVIDNGSADGSREVVEQKFPEVTLISFPENTGFCHAVNEGIRAADTEYVILLNNDTRAEPGFIRQLVDGMEALPDAFSASAKLLSMREPGIIDDAGDFYCALGWAYARGKGEDAGRYGKRERIFAACAGAAIYRRAVFEEIGMFDEAHFAYLEDIDIGYRARIAGYHNYYLPGAVVYHAGSAVSGSRHNDFKVRLSARNSIYLVYKNMPVWQLVLNLPLLLPGFFIKYLYFCRKKLGRGYREGIAEGIRSLAGRRRKIKKMPYKKQHLPHYAAIQLELWHNVIRLLLRR